MIMKFELTPTVSDIFILIYVSLTLFWRIQMEMTRPVGVLVSIITGIAFIMILYLLIKVRFLNPNWFGFFKTKDEIK